MVSDHVAASDCERIRPGLVAQPANTVSSLTFCLGGAWIWSRAGDTDTPTGWRTVAATAVAAGFGSAAYHGPGGRWSRVAHDTSNVLLLAALAGALIDGGAPTRPPLQHLAGLSAVTGLAVHRFSRSGRRLCCPDCRMQGHAAWHILVATAVVATAESHRSPT